MSPRHNRLGARLIARLEGGLDGSPCGVYSSDQKVGLPNDELVYARCALASVQHFVLVSQREPRVEVYTAPRRRELLIRCPGEGRDCHRLITRQRWHGSARSQRWRGQMDRLQPFRRRRGRWKAKLPARACLRLDDRSG